MFEISDSILIHFYKLNRTSGLKERNLQVEMALEWRHGLLVTLHTGHQLNNFPHGGFYQQQLDKNFPP